jgi:hypothetical protein
MSTDTDTIATRRACVRRHCSTLCIAMVVARFMPAIALVEPAPPVAAHALSDARPSTVLQLTAHLCMSRGTCGSATATVSIAARDAPEW